VIKRILWCFGKLLRRVMARVLVLLWVWSIAMRWAVAQSATLDFFNYSGMQATISCEDHPANRLEAGETFSIPLSRSDQACIVTLKDGEHASATIDKLLPLTSSNSGHSVSVDINDTFLLFALDETPHHQYVNFLDSQDEYKRSSDLLLW
jgi:hypothetical protein